jgi:hypothetical protein
MNHSIPTEPFYPYQQDRGKGAEYILQCAAGKSEWIAEIKKNPRFGDFFGQLVYWVFTGVHSVAAGLTPGFVPAFVPPDTGSLTFTNKRQLQEPLQLMVRPSESTRILHVPSSFSLQPSHRKEPTTLLVVVLTTETLPSGLVWVLYPARMVTRVPSLLIEVPGGRLLTLVCTILFCVWPV